MTEFLVIRLPVADTQPFSWIVADGDGQGLAMPESGSLADAARRARQRPVIALAPGEDVLLTTASLPVRGMARMQQAAPFALEEQLAQDVSELHFAVGARAPDGHVPVAAVARERMEAWAAQFAAAGLRPDSLVADTSGVPQHAGFTLLIDGPRTLIRDPRGRLLAGETADVAALVAAMGAAPEDPAGDSHLYCPDNEAAALGQLMSDLRMLLPDLEMHTLRHGALPVLAAGVVAGDRHHPNLLQGEFGETGALNQYWHAWRQAAVLAGVFVLVVLGLKAAEVLTLKAEMTDLREQINAVAAEALPANARIVDPVAQMEQLHTRLRGGSGVSDAFFLEMLESLAGAFGGASDVSIGKLDYRNGTMDLTLTAPSVDMLDQIRRRVEADGLQAEVQSSNKIDIGVQGRLRISRGSS